MVDNDTTVPERLILGIAVLLDKNEIYERKLGGIFFHKTLIILLWVLDERGVFPMLPTDYSTGRVFHLSRLDLSV